MKIIEEQLVERLHDRANAAELQFSVDDVRAPVADVSPLVGRTERHRRPLLAVAAVLAVLGGTATYVANRQTSTQLESRTDAAEDTAVAVQELTITATGDEPERLSADGIVLSAAQVGNIEVGSPSETLLAEAPWLEGALCVATATGVGCAPAEAVVVGSPPEAEHSSYGSNDGQGFHMVMASSPTSPFIFVENDVVIVSGLPDIAVAVDADLGGDPLLQRPLAGTAAFPMPAAATTIRIQARDARGLLVWDSLPFDLPLG